MADKETIKPIYSELQGYLTQAPDNEPKIYIYDKDFWEHYNRTLKELNSLTGKDYDKFKLRPITNLHGGDRITNTAYRQKLGGLIALLHAEYFLDEIAPFSGMPNTVIHQNQIQNQDQSQSMQVKLALEMSDLIHEKLSKAKDGSKEKTFLEKIKGSLSSVKNASQLITLLITTANQLGLSIDDLRKLFS